METALEVNHLTYVFPDGTGITDVSFCVMRQDIYFLYGNHGAGKTVVLQALAGTIYPQAGTMKLFGNPNYQEEKCRLGYVPQTPYTIGKMSMSEMLHYFALSFGVLDGTFESALELHIEEKKPVCRLPVFVQKKVNLGIALLGKPDLVIIDDPFGGLDTRECEQLLSIISSLKEIRGIPFLLTGRKYDVASRIATKYGVIASGKIITELTPAKLNEKCERCIKIRTSGLRKAIPLLQNNFPQYEVLADDLVRVFCPMSCSAEINALLVSAGIDVEEIWIAGMDEQEYLSKLAKGDIAYD